MIDGFAEISGDHQWIHVDVERAKAESPFGGPIAHGNLTLATIDGFRDGLMVQEGFKLGVNYGWNKVRFPAPVPVDCEDPRLDRDRLGGRQGWRLAPGGPALDGRGRRRREAGVRGRLGYAGSELTGLGPGSVPSNSPSIRAPIPLASSGRAKK